VPFRKTCLVTVVASANILYKLGRDDARTALSQVLEAGPDLVALQEWYVVRLRLLRERGDVRLVPGLTIGTSKPAYHWVSAVAGGNVVGARADRYDLLEAHAPFLSCAGRSDRPDRFLRTEPPREATVGVFRDRAADRTVAILSYHLVPGVEREGDYRADRPLLVRRHRGEVRRLERLVADLQREGHDVHAAGDANLDGLRLAGLTSAWEGREDHPGTIGKATRKLDDVHGPGPATDVRLVHTPSDHRAVLVTRPSSGR
jgi:endonuclease/exonuclease/phosphatase family metal-dependent hydrolase